MTRKDDRDRAVDEVLRRSHAAKSIGTPSSACLDPETLALWVDDGLSAAERTTAERHVADCSRCQAALAALVRTAPIPEPSKPWWQLSRAAWLAPLTAAAAALVIWIVVPSAPPTPASRERATPAPASAPSPQAATEEVKKEVKEEANKQDAPRPPAGERRDEKRVVETELPVAPPTQTLAPASEVAAAPPAEAPPASPPARSSTAPRSFSAAAADSAKSVSQNAIAPEIVSPDPMSRWRIRGRIVERSTDGGATWQEQATGATSTLTAGAAPSPSICWIVGQDGVVLLSTDGRTWRKVQFPATTALVSVRAVDERTATVTDANGRTYATTDGGVRWTQGP
jgi:hypothetical protein